MRAEALCDSAPCALAATMMRARYARDAARARASAMMRCGFMRRALCCSRPRYTLPAAQQRHCRARAAPQDVLQAAAAQPRRYASMRAPPMLMRAARCDMLP